MFLLGLLWCYQRSVAPVTPFLTEEGQSVVTSRHNWQLRELAKRLPLDEAWPEGKAFEAAMKRFGLEGDAIPPNIPMPAEITDGVYLIGQDAPTNRTYLVDCGAEGVALIDPGYESEFERMVANVGKCGYPRKSIRWVINTHNHVDHAMADRKFHELGAEIIIHAADADVVEKGLKLPPAAARKSGVSEIPSCKVDRRLSDGEDLRLGNKTFHVIHAPGHSPGCACLLLQAGGKNVLISGDVVLYDGQLGGQTSPSSEYLASLEKLEDYRLDGVPVRWDMLLPGHGTIVMDHAYLDIQKGREALEHDVAMGRTYVLPYSRPEYRKRMFGRAASKP